MTNATIPPVVGLLNGKSATSPVKNLRVAASMLGGEVSGNRILCPGPGHSKHDRSLSVSFEAGAPDGLLVHSFAGDDPITCKDHVRAILGIPFEPQGRAPGNRPNIVATYDYHDELGELLFQVVRLDPKSFRQRRPDGRGGWIWGMDGVRRVLYRLPEVNEAAASGRRVYVVEGEKSVDAMFRRGLIATCSPGGAGKWRDEYSPMLAGAEVVILPDNDAPGRKHAEDVETSLRSIAVPARIATLPGLQEKGDVADLIAAGATAERIEELSAPLRVIDGGKKPDGPAAPSIEPFRPFFAGEGRTSKPPMHIKGLLRKRGVVLIGGQSQAGKSYVAIALALALATGGSFFGKPVQEKVGVIYAAAEGDDTIQPRLIAAQRALGIPDMEPLPICVFQDFRMPKRGEPKKDMFAPFVANVAAAREVFADRGMPAPGVIFIDTASAGIDMDDENANSVIAEVVDRARQLGEVTGMLVAIVHHFGKDASKKLRGGSAWFANSDQVISVLAKVDENGIPQNPRSLFLDKLRGYPAGHVGNFELTSVVIGVDEDGDDESEAHISIIGGQAVTVANMTPASTDDATARNKSRSGRGSKTFRDAFNEAMHSGTRRQIERGGSERREMLCVELEDVRKEFFRIYAGGGADATRKAWKRALADIAERGFGYSTEVCRLGVEWIWRADMQQAAMMEELVGEDT